MRITRWSLLLLFCGASGAAGGLTPPDTLLFRSALIIRAAPGFPDNIARKDPVEAAFVRGAWSAPAAGETMRYNDTASGTWEQIAADSAGWFDHPSLEGGYVFTSIDLDADATMLLAAMGNSMAYVNGVPRSGNPYAYKDSYEAWEPRFDYSLLPVRLKKGTNQFIFHCSRGRFKARLISPRSETFINTKDLTVPDIIAGWPFGAPAGVVIVNASGVSLEGWFLGAALPGKPERYSLLPPVPPFSIRKVPFTLFDPAPPAGGGQAVILRLRDGMEHIRDTAGFVLRVVGPRDARKETFISAIDSSVQYYAVLPASGDAPSPALFLSLHGASVEAINQAQAYAPKQWGMIVAPTNRRPYGFNWEDWGRWDALEVLALVKKRYAFDESRIYLTGHSMGGHGVYHLGSLFPDQFAALGPSAGWLSFWTYRVREPIVNPSPMRQMLMRATLPSDTHTMAVNYARLGVYILHGSEDDNVPADQSRLMAKQLEGFHRDFVYHEQQGAGHWWDLSDAPGADCVDWAPLFDFFARHARPMPARIRHVVFATPGPGVSAACDWARIEAQRSQFHLSIIDLRYDPGMNRIEGSSSNVERLVLDTKPWDSSGPFTVTIDSQRIAGVRPDSTGRVWLRRAGDAWSAGGPPSPGVKNSLRAGTFKDLFRNHVMFVYGTAGSPEENAWAFAKARFDAERFWYQGNGSIDVVADSVYAPRNGTERNVVLYGNGTTNRAWTALLGDCPVQVSRGNVTVAGKRFAGDDLACLVIRPRPGSFTASVGAVAGTGITGMRLTDRMPYLLPGVAYPDLIVGRASMLSAGEEGMVVAGFFGQDWSFERGEFVWE
jgi:poly(3-hydroxybutyrate) depolymerase